MVKESLTYEQTGVSYEDMDPWKIECQKAARGTSGNLSRQSLKEVDWSRGESAYLIEGEDRYYGHVQEGLGTKNLVADEMYKLTGRSFYDAIAIDAVAAIVNDLSTLGVSPVSVGMHVASGNSSWFTDESRRRDFVEGFQRGCDLAGAVWGPGESPTLVDLVSPSSVEISGSTFGIAYPKERLIRPNIQSGDIIVLVESSGIHANGLTLARQLANRLTNGFLTPINADVLTYGEALLEPSRIYSRLVDRLLDERVSLHYAVHITGHGWRKLMRHSEPFRYVIEEVPESPEIFAFIQEEGPVSDTEAYATFNMGAGYAFIVPQSAASQTVSLAEAAGFRAWDAGHVEASESREVAIMPLNIAYNSASLDIRSNGD